ncbi:hypothetical protein FA95DRAFT_782644 [Auriscalpium vulgare]|uniref:Uncharacterized protein n=1 Tax=Auriscalpium vulgare TaxID=40419 RepID=A0ACB8RB08_9AGAM|nr:hypothetical protein FA95DRAFT_782644 [Auriscalpium vulgare]
MRCARSLDTRASGSRPCVSASARGRRRASSGVGGLWASTSSLARHQRRSVGRRQRAPRCLGSTALRVAAPRLSMGSGVNCVESHNALIRLPSLPCAAPVRPRARPIRRGRAACVSVRVGRCGRRAPVRVGCGAPWEGRAWWEGERGGNSCRGACAAEQAPTRARQEASRYFVLRGRRCNPRRERRAAERNTAHGVRLRWRLGRCVADRHSRCLKGFVIHSTTTTRLHRTFGATRGAVLRGHER